MRRSAAPKRKGVFTPNCQKAAQEYYTNAGYDVMVGFPNDKAYLSWIKIGWDCTWVGGFVSTVQNWKFSPKNKFI